MTRGLWQHLDGAHLLTILVILRPVSRHGAVCSPARIPVSREVMIWGSASIALAIFSVVVNESPAVLGAGFFAKGFAIIIGSVLGLIGALIGDALRKFVRPSGYFTTGGFFSLLLLKLFWIAGPQVIGLLIGVFLGVSLVLS